MEDILPDIGLNTATEAVQKLLEGETTWWLSWAFVWDATPQGRDHWLNRHAGHVPLDDADKEYLRSLL